MEPISPPVINHIQPPKAQLPPLFVRQQPKQQPLKVRRKKIPVPRDPQEDKLVFRTSPPLELDDDEMANNRTEDDKRCKNTRLFVFLV